MRFSFLKKPEHIALTIIFTNILILIGTDIHLPALPNLQEDLNTTEFKAQLVLVVFFVGAIISRLIWGPMSDMYGRKKVILTTIGLQIISQTGSITAPTIDLLIFWRAIQSLGAGVISVVGTAVVSDLFKGDKRSRYLGLQEMSFPIAYVIAPVIGAFIFESFGTWRATFMFVLLFQIIAWFIFYLFLPETNTTKHTSKLLATYKRYLTILKDTDFLLLNLLSSIIIGSYMMFVVVSPFIYMTDYGLTPADYAYYQFTPMILNILASLIYRRIVEIYGTTNCLKIGLKSLFILIPIYFSLAFEVIPITPHTILTAVCIQSFIVPFFIPGVTSKSLELYHENRGLAASASASIRGLCMSITMLFGGYFIGSDVSYVFFTKGVLTCFVIIIFLHLAYSNRKLRLNL